MNTREATAQKVEEIIQELKATGLWRKQPDWVQVYEEAGFSNRSDFLDWLQFIYLPNCMTMPAASAKGFIVPQAARFFGDDMQKGKLLQLLIELDSLL